MYNTNWPLHQNTSTSNVDWGALADSWMQQREQQAQWQQAPLPPPPPPPPQFLLSAPPIPPPGLPPIGMTFPPLPPTQLGIGSHHHQLQVGSNTTQESLTMTNIENSHWRPPPPPPHQMMMPSGPQWRPNMNNNQPIFPMQSDMASPFGGPQFWLSNNTGQQAVPPPPPVPAPVPPPVPPQQSPIPPTFSAPSFQHPPIDKRIMNTSFNTSIPSLMDLPSYGKNNSTPPPMPVPPVPVLPIAPPVKIANIPSGVNTNAKRRKIPAWLREELGRLEKEKEKKMQNSSNDNNSFSLNESYSKFDDDNQDDEEDETNDEKFNESTTRFDDDDDEDDENGEDTEQNDEEELHLKLVSSTPIVNRRSRFDDDKPTEPQQQLNVSAISRRTHSPPPSTNTATTTLIEDDQIDKEAQLMNKLRRTLTELLLEVTNEEFAAIAKEVYLSCKAESSTPVIRKASGLSSLMQSFSGSDSDDEETHGQSIVDTTVKNKSPIRAPVKQPNVLSKSTNKAFDDDSKLNKSKDKKSTRERSPSSSSSSHDHKNKKHHHKKHRRRSSSSSSSHSSQSRLQKKKKSSNHDHHSEHNKSRKIIIHFISRNPYTITVNIDVSRNDPLNITNGPVDKIQFNKPTQVLAMIINERIPDSDLWKFISNSIVFFQKLNIEHLIIYDYEGYIKAREASIMDYVHTCDKKSM
ncbi:unnamed protein product [Rotaria socialis]|uniref:Uncharacterized protein n=1 Tax=Rotaria socialis TaxID=392032 RepID=A0A819VVI4_9BILA|nr:unnamed protein product [Rotaria socialis]